jgi:hypothetical protein
VGASKADHRAVNLDWPAKETAKKRKAPFKELRSRLELGCGYSQFSDRESATTNVGYGFPVVGILKLQRGFPAKGPQLQGRPNLSEALVWDTLRERLKEIS